MAEQALKIAKEKKFPDIILGEILTNLGNIRRDRYHASGSPKELDLSIEAAEDSLQVDNMSNSTKATRLKKPCNTSKDSLREDYEFF